MQDLERLQYRKIYQYPTEHIETKFHFGTDQDNKWTLKNKTKQKFKLTAFSGAAFIAAAILLIGHIYAIWKIGKMPIFVLIMYSTMFYNRTLKLFDTRNWGTQLSSSLNTVMFMLQLGTVTDGNDDDDTNKDESDYVHGTMMKNPS